jgi:hypothetical protein
MFDPYFRSLSDASHERPPDSEPNA